ncbi:helix-turn-helix domain-containing protein [Streptomyces sp. PanSC9]|uniref:helix-turn-helix domain-containing protein n=1 Tax=Streptomyces sp. PanSC9 TaxID=1520461 RepID=UPI00288ABA14|nr:helix-turn-helix domain-containing protein [Streptomyces sp. PanSC9]
MSRLRQTGRRRHRRALTSTARRRSGARSRHGPRGTDLAGRPATGTPLDARPSGSPPTRPTPLRDWPLATVFTISGGSKVVREPAQGTTPMRASRQETGCPPSAGEPASFGQLLRSLRQQRGLSLSQLANRAHFNRGHVSKIENGKRPPSVSFARACDRALDAGTTFATIALALESASRPQQGWVRPGQLPSAKRNFVGRQEEMRHLDGLLRGTEQALAVPVAVISGLPGVGKTAVAVQWAHHAVNSGHFRDGQLFVNLQGPGPGTAATPSDVLAGLLRTLGVPADRIPADLDQRAATFRSYLHGREMLLVLDNAADAQQIYPLLPGSPGCAVVVTSRSRLPGLMSVAEAATLRLTELCQPEAALLLRAIIGDPRADADPGAVDLLADRCGRLPLALVLAGEHIVSRQQRSADALARELKPERARLNLAEGDVVLRDAFATSYRALDEQSARLFRLLGLLPSRLIDADATAATAGVSQDEASRMLRGLASMHLIHRQDERHYLMHQLLRTYAADLARQMDKEAGHIQALRSTLDGVTTGAAPLSSLVA